MLQFREYFNTFYACNEFVIERIADTEIFLNIYMYVLETNNMQLNIVHIFLQIESFRISRCNASRRQAGSIKLIGTAKPTAQFYIEIVQL